MTASSSKDKEDAQFQAVLQHSWSTYLEEEEKRMVRAKDKSMLLYDEESDRSGALERSKVEFAAADLERAIEESSRDHLQRLSVARTPRQLRNRPSDDALPLIELEPADDSRRGRHDVPCPSIRVELHPAREGSRYLMRPQHPVLFTELHTVRYRLREDDGWRAVDVSNVPIMEMVQAITGSGEARVHYLSSPNSNEEEATIPRAAAFRPMLLGDLARLVGGWDNVWLILERD
ncbi:hypothetical protein HII31_09435 [Pseudocercospora fuligena]|uniref:Uncharacterized protein n=1 Tax=Pseudocercospora fuligena TaxID=685502 RepID=A0A8H6VG59_9PEZI|nr:hypothetical protein HII31_09435 [Pseudocercospora fuligena]